MKKALLLFAMFAFIGTAYTATASVENSVGIYCDGGHKCDDDCKKNCKKGKKACANKSSAKKGCCAKQSTAAAKSCHGKTGSKASATAEPKRDDAKK